MRRKVALYSRPTPILPLGAFGLIFLVAPATASNLSYVTREISARRFIEYLLALAHHASSKFSPPRFRKERSQLAHRSKLGLHEKHEDYVLRARDYRSKRDRLHTLKVKAETKNKDEFYFGMNGRKTEKGVEYRSRGGEGALPEDMVKVLKTQDEGYLRTVRKKGLKLIDAIKTQLTAMIDLVPTPEDIDDLDDDVVIHYALREFFLLKNQVLERERAKQFKRHLGILCFWITMIRPVSAAQGAWESESEGDSGGWSDHDMDEDERDQDPYAPQRAQKQEAKRQAAAKARLCKHRLALLHELSARLQRDTVLRHTLRELELQKQLMAPGARSKIRGPERVERDEEDDDGGNKKKRGEAKFARQGDINYTPRVYKWRSERKR
ncbi:Utp11 domain protein [Rhizoctonia solani 123E]|uniref:Utp11 domain protein n=1 Tax=Rhizoctonia solani 123E TaxID=1423351 RepID=A0A074RIW0_9AGAM|nr:Utp11 domain protein [Rhizoctonia solani 123E]